VIKPIKIFRSLSFFFSSAGVRGLVWLNFENRILDLASMEIEKYVTRKFCLVINFEHYDLIVPYPTWHIFIIQIFENAVQYFKSCEKSYFLRIFKLKIREAREYFLGGITQLLKRNKPFFKACVLIYIHSRRGRLIPKRGREGSLYHRLVAERRFKLLRLCRFAKIP